MARRPNTPDPARVARPRTAVRFVAPTLAMTAALAFSSCSVTFNPGPGEAAFETTSWQLGEAAEPVRNPAVPGSASASGAEQGGGSGAENEATAEDEATAETVPGDHESVVDALESGTIAVRPAPSPDDKDGTGHDEDGRTSADTQDAGAAEDGTDDDGTSGADTGGTGSDGGTAAEPDLSDPAQYARVLEAEVNERREAHGVTALRHDECAYAEALERAEALRGMELAHAPLESVFDRCPTSTVGENLARGGWSPSEAADGWMNSEGHRANILNAGFTRGAIACISEGTSYGPQMTCAHVFLG